MLKKRSKSISLLVVMAFMFTMILPSMAFAGGMCDFSFSTAEGLEAGSDNPQALGFIRVEEMEPAEAVYVDIELPDDVEWQKAVKDIGIGKFIELQNSECSVNWIQDTKKNKYSVCVNTSKIYDDSDAWDKFYIEAKFKDDSAVMIDNGAENDLVVKVTARGTIGTSTRWDESKECLIGTTGDGELTVTAKSPKSISVGDEQKLAKLTFTENFKSALQEKDEFILTLPSDIEWDWDYMTGKNDENKPIFSKDKDNDWVITGDYGLTAKVSLNDGNKDELRFLISEESSPFKDEFEFTGYVIVYPGANDGEVEVDIDAASKNKCDFDDTSLVVANVGDTDMTVDIDDDSDDNIYPGVYGKELDTFTLEGSADFAEGDKITMSLSDGARWYMEDFNSIDNVESLGFYDDNQSVWLKFTASTDEIEFENLKVATLPDCPVGDITITIDEDYSGEFVIGEVLAAVEVSADAPLVSLATMDSPAGDIVFTETAKDVWTDDYYSDSEVKADPFLKLSLPSGVGFSDEPTVLVNGDDVDADFYYDYGYDYDKDGERTTSTTERFSDGDEDIYIVFDEDDFSDSKIDTIEITDVAYDLDSRVKGSDVEVEVSGNIVNFLLGAQNDKPIEDFEEDYADDPVFTVVNATTKAEGTAESVFTIGSATYTIDGEEFTMDVAPYIAGDRTYLPVRFVAYAMGISDNNILWDQAAQTVTLMKGDKVVQLKVGSTTMMINGAAVTMDVAPQNTSDRVCLPIRFVAQAFGAEVDWDAATQQVNIGF